MSYTARIITNSLITWVVLSGLGFLAAFLQEDEYGIIMALVGIFAVGALLAAGLLIAGAIILLARIDSAPRHRPSEHGVIDQSTEPTVIPYRERGLAFLQAGGLILLIGGSVCLGML